MEYPVIHYYNTSSLYAKNSALLSGRCPRKDKDAALSISKEAREEA
jgi:hypothetical protein